MKKYVSSLEMYLFTITSLYQYYKELSALITCFSLSICLDHLLQFKYLP